MKAVVISDVFTYLTSKKCVALFRHLTTHTVCLLMSICFWYHHHGIEAVVFLYQQSSKKTSEGEKQECF